MSKITKNPETPQEFYECHKKHWGCIVEMEEEYEELGGATFVKETAFERCFNFNPRHKRESCCFACDFSTTNFNKVGRPNTFSCLRYCLLHCNNFDSTISHCLDGEYSTFCNSISQGDYRRAKIAAENIRDLPINKDIL